MKYVEVVADAGSADTVSAIAEKLEVSDFRFGAAELPARATVSSLLQFVKLS